MTKVAVLGCGPAGLLAAEAAGQLGMVTDIFACKPAPSKMPGAQFLHEAIPHLTVAEPDGYVSNYLVGAPENYREKVYGDLKLPTEWNVTSVEVTSPTQPAWDLRRVYDQLWKFFGDAIQDTRNPIDADWIETFAMNYDWILSTIPKPALCRTGHQFSSVRVYISDQYFFGGSFLRPDNLDVVVCNSEQNPSWYRTSRVFGHKHTEWPDAGTPPPLDGVVEVQKPLLNQCNCWDGTKVIGLGRYGKWRKGVLVHHVYQEAMINLVDGAFH